MTCLLRVLKFKDSSETEVVATDPRMRNAAKLLGLALLPGYGSAIGQMETVYIETSVISYLVADPSRDLVTAANQQVTRDWWQQRRASFACLASQEVVAEASRGNPEQVRRRLALLVSLPRVAVSADAETLARLFLSTGCLPPKAARDAVHLAVATAIAADYLLTWNCRHLANAQILKRLDREVQLAGRALPRVCTPLELMGDLPYGNESSA